MSFLCRDAYSCHRLGDGATVNTRDIHRLLAKDRHVALATNDRGQPRVRMMTIKCHAGKLWCFTGASSTKASQLKVDRRFEFVANLYEEGSAGSLRATGLATIVTDPQKKKELADSFPSFKDHWQSPIDPDFMLLRLDVETVEIERGPDAKAERYVLKKA